MLRLLLIILVSLTLTGCQKGGEPPPPPQPVEETVAVEEQKMKLTSTAFENNQDIPVKYTCDGENISPPLMIAELPEGAKNLALIVDDPDAPAGDWVHWLVWNIDPATTTIAEDSLPAGAVQGTTDFGDQKYGGPCPPSGAHRYQFKLYALDTKLNLDSTTKKAGLEQAIQNHVLEQTMLVGRYQRG